MLTLLKKIISTLTKKIMRSKISKVTAPEDHYLSFSSEFQLLNSTVSVILRIKQILWTSLFLFMKKYLILNLKLKLSTFSNVCSSVPVHLKTHLFHKDIVIFHLYLTQLTKYFSYFLKTITSSINISKEENPNHLTKITISMKEFIKKSPRRFISAFYALLFVIWTSWENSNKCTLKKLKFLFFMQ